MPPVYPPPGSKCRIVAMNQYRLPDWLEDGALVTVISSEAGNVLVKVRDEQGRECELLRVNLKPE